MLNNVWENKSKLLEENSHSWTAQQTSEVHVTGGFYIAEVKELGPHLATENIALKSEVIVELHVNFRF